ncbi:hypothetical protein E2C01_005634 [Portunus trituberculatus]|uniref:Uncharacterized protein n=1 Tax=Portunus trituberculatus TaxID=210409 RepID=A0A5B7CU19_PORTR|nr:hypothetical protein [Portunus trituberculatus]
MAKGTYSMPRWDSSFWELVCLQSRKSAGAHVHQPSSESRRELLALHHLLVEPVRVLGTSSLAATSKPVRGATAMQAGPVTRQC